jgi:hypothetical protein
MGTGGGSTKRQSTGWFRGTIKSPWPMSLNEKGTSISYYIRLKCKSFALKIQIMTEGWPAGRMGWQSPWCRSTLFSYKTLLFPAKTVFLVFWGF